MFYDFNFKHFRVADVQKMKYGTIVILYALHNMVYGCYFTFCRLQILIFTDFYFIIADLIVTYLIITYLITDLIITNYLILTY